MHNSTGIISCERFCLELPSQAPSFISVIKRNIPKTAVIFDKIEQPLHPVPRDPI